MRRKDLGELETVLGGENQTAVVEGDRPPQHRRPISHQIGVVDDCLGIVLAHDPAPKLSITGP